LQQFYSPGQTVDIFKLRKKYINIVCFVTRSVFAASAVQYQRADDTVHGASRLAPCIWRRISTALRRLVISPLHTLIIVKHQTRVNCSHDNFYLQYCSIDFVSSQILYSGEKNTECKKRQWCPESVEGFVVSMVYQCIILFYYSYKLGRIVSSQKRACSPPQFS